MIGLPARRTAAAKCRSAAVKPRPRVDDKQDRVAIRERGFSLRAHPPGERLGIAFRQTRRVDDREREIGNPGVALAAIARDAGLIVDQRELASDEPVEQRRLADVRPADDRDLGAHGVSAGRAGEARRKATSPPIGSRPPVRASGSPIAARPARLRDRRAPDRALWPHRHSPCARARARRDRAARGAGTARPRPQARSAPPRPSVPRRRCRARISAARSRAASRKSVGIAESPATASKAAAAPCGSLCALTPAAVICASAR